MIVWTHDPVGTDPAYAWMRRRSASAYAIVAKPQPLVIYVAISKVRQRQLAEVLSLPLTGIPLIPNGIDALRFAGLGPKGSAAAGRGGSAGG